MGAVEMGGTRQNLFGAWLRRGGVEQGLVPDLLRSRE